MNRMREVRDRANDAIRADGREIRAKVIGEGGNLGCTQRGRVEYAQSGGPEKAGGRINTDFIDNSAGVNTSDLEVNIKILLSDVERRKGRLTRAARNKLLASMTDEVAALVLRNNYLQSQAISVLEQRAPERLSEYQSLIRALERGGHLNRAIEFLPGDDEFPERRKQTPRASRVPNSPWCWPTARSGSAITCSIPTCPTIRTSRAKCSATSPRPMRKRYAREIPRHRLRREIIATATTNSLVNRMGPVFVARAQEDTDADPAAISRAYTIAREIFSMRSLWADIEVAGQRGAAPSVQYGMFYRTSRLLRHTSYWLLRERGKDLHIEDGGARTARRRRAADRRHRLGDRRRRRARSTKPRWPSSPAAACRRNWRGASRAWRCSNPRSTSWRWRAANACRSPTWRACISNSACRWASTGCTARSTGSSVDGSWQATARTGLRDAAMRAHRELTQQVLRTRGAKRVGERARRAGARSAPTRSPSWKRTLTEMRAVGSRGFRHAHRGRRRGARSVERLDAKVRLALVITTYERPDALAAVLDSVGAPARRARPKSSSPTMVRAPPRARSSQRSSRARACRCALVSQPHDGLPRHAPAQSRASPRHRRTTWCSSTATCCCIREFIADHARLARAGVLHPGRARARRCRADRTADRRAGAAALDSGRRVSAGCAALYLLRSPRAGLADAHARQRASSPSRPATRASGATTWCASTASTKRSRAGARRTRSCARDSRMPASAARRCCSAASPATCTMHRHRAPRCPRIWRCSTDARRERRVRCDRGLDAHFAVAPRRANRMICG